MKKIIILLITAMVCFSLVLSGCGSSGDEEKVETESEKSEETEKVSEESDSIYTETGTFPIVKEKIKLNFLSFSAPMIVDRETNEFTKYMEDKTNIEIGWELVPMDQQTE
jgi:putative aldouronate transport system substrate-binding protein